jgi:predicted amidohydrolase YtcJ
LRRDDQLGSIEVGKLADFTVLADDPYQVAPTDLGSIEVVDTILGGIPT